LEKRLCNGLNLKFTNIDSLQLLLLYINRRRAAFLINSTEHLNRLWAITFNHYLSSSRRSSVPSLPTVVDRTATLFRRQRATILKEATSLTSHRTELYSYFLFTVVDRSATSFRRQRVISKLLQISISIIYLTLL